LATLRLVTRVACQPLSLAYNYDNHTVYAVNDSRFAESGAVATVRVFDLDANEIFSRELDLDMAAAGSEPLVSLAELDSPTPVYFLDLQLADGSGAELARNFYWLSTRPDVLDYENHKWFVTPTKGFADFAALDDLPEVVLEASIGVSPGENGAEVTVLLSNPSDAIAFFVELKVVDAEGSSILPILWDDNYVSILPGESRELTARFPTEDDVSGATLALQGWNVPAVEVGLAAE